MLRWYFLIFTVFMSGAFCRSQSDSKEALGNWDRQRVQSSLEVLTAEPHPTGSERQAQLANWLQAEAEKIGLEVTVDSFPIQVPDPALLGGGGSLMQKTTLELTARNVYAKHKVPGSDCLILLGSHYDSKRMASGIHVGANDSGSSSAALLEIMHQMQTQTTLKCSILAVWFDGEESWLPEWRDGQDRHPAQIQDNLYGSRHLAQQLETCAQALCLPARLGGDQVKAMILLDMIGMPDVRLTIDSYSNSGLMQMARELDQSLFSGSLYGRSSPKPIDDDHRPFLQRGLPALNLIDFENLQTWHQAGDRLETLDPASIEKVSLLAIALTLKISQGN